MACRNLCLERGQPGRPNIQMREKKKKRGQEKGSSLPLTHKGVFDNMPFMSRPLRIQYPNAWYHVMKRGRRGESVFESKDDYQLFLDILHEAIELFSLRISAYCLMTNHYHLLVQTPDSNLSRCMRHINGVYTQRFNAAHGLDGQLFRDRYKAILVGEDSYLLQLIRYIHKNPLRAGMVKRAELYEWSSHKGFLSRAQNWDWLHKQFILTMTSKDPKQQLKL